MKYNTLKKIGRIALIGSILYFLNSRELIAPEKGTKLDRDPRKVVVLDPGHGMSNRKPGVMHFGATYKNKKYKEVEIVLEQAKKIKEMLNPSFYKVILTRYDNKTPTPIESRPKLANELNADIFISLHINQNKDVKDIGGFEIYYKVDESKRLAELAAENLETITQIPKRWVRKEDYLVLKGVKCPAALLEIGYMPKDLKYILDTIPNIEKAVAKTIEDYLK